MINDEKLLQLDKCCKKNIDICKMFIYLFILKFIICIANSIISNTYYDDAINPPKWLMKLKMYISSS